MKTCRKCGAVKVQQDFYSGHGTCKGCRRAEARANHEKTRPARIEKMRAHNLKNNYNLTVEQANAILAKGCAICGTFERLCIDHDHKTGVIRGCLCNRHNLGLGKFQDSAAELKAAIRYLGE